MYLQGVGARLVAVVLVKERIEGCDVSGREGVEARRMLLLVEPLLRRPPACARRSRVRMWARVASAGVAP